MGLFFRRPLALFSFLFLIFALLSYNISIPMMISGIILTLLIIGLICIFAFIFKKIKMKLLVTAVCVFAILLALLQSLFCIAIPMARAEAYEGENVVLCYVIDGPDEGRYGKSYVVKVKRIGDEKVSIRAFLTCDFDLELRGGDEIYGAAQILAQSGDEPSQILSLYMEDSENCYVRYASEGKGIAETLFSECGIEIMSCRLSELIRERLYDLLGETRGALAMGFFTGDRSGIATEIIRDFRRAGVSHLMAVSGTHIAILLGGIELLLRKLQVHKNIRIVAVTLFSIGFLFITGFSLSAIRSVFMLYAVYLCYFLREGSDSVTALFVSVAAIVLIFPYSIVDLGLWMSFLATLGLLTAYPLIEEKIPYPRKKSKVMLLILKVARALLLIAIMTIVANMYLLPVIWIYFGELSLVSVISNILITYPSSLFLLFVPILLLTYRIPLLGFLIKAVVSFLADMILSTVKLCSEMPNATVSLKYEFCKYIVILFAVGMIVCLTVRLEKKIFALLPFGFAITAFSLCFVIYSTFISSPSVTYLNYGKNEILAVNDNTELSICDNSSGGLSAFWSVRGLVDSSYATRIDKYIYTDYREGSAISLERLSKYVLIDSLYLPTPADDNETVLAQSLYELASESGIEVVFYNENDIIRPTKNVMTQIVRREEQKGNTHILFICDGKSIAHSSAELCQMDRAYDILIIGESYDKDKTYDLLNVSAEEVYVSSRALSDNIILSEETSVYVPSDSKKDYKIELRFK